MRITLEEFQLEPLRVHAFLAGVPLHDVWVIRLEGGGEGRTLRDFQALFSAESLQRANVFVRALFWLRWELGRLFGWEVEEDAIPASSYVHRLTHQDRARSLETPGAMNSRLGPFRVIYGFENESLHEIINLTAHAFSLMAMEPAGRWLYRLLGRLRQESQLADAGLHGAHRSLPPPPSLPGRDPPAGAGVARGVRYRVKPATPFLRSMKHLGCVLLAPLRRGFKVPTYRDLRGLGCPQIP